MRLIAGLAVLAGILALAGVWATGGFATLAWWASQQQHGLQSDLATSLRNLRSGQSAAFWSLILICLSYGFLHAIGPGHGKVLISGAALGSRGTALRMSLIAVAGSLAQAAFAIVIVYGGLALFQATARGTVAAAEGWIQPIGHLLIAAVGATILVKGLRSLRRTEAGCHGHDHGPAPDQVARATGGRDAVALVLAMAARPCAGALVVLVLAWSFGLWLAGIAAVFAMGLGTAAFTVLIAVLAVASRDATLFSAGSGRIARVALPTLQILAGGTVLTVSLILLSETLARL